jgi:hypothetical protein
MVDDRTPREVAALWRPERPGRRSPKDLGDSIVEPDWGGARVAAALIEDEATLWRDGAEVPVPDELRAALVDAFRALDAVVEGHVTTMALRSGAGALPALPSVERPPILIPKAFRKSVKDDPYVHARDHQAEVAAVEPRVLDALERGERHAFVATDLLWLDGESLVDVPLLERKRHLETILESSDLVRVTPFIRPSAILTMVTWGSLGFRELTHRATNSRYLAGRESPDRCVARPPESPLGAARGPVSPR